MNLDAELWILTGLCVGVLGVAFLVAVWRQRASAGNRNPPATARADAADMPEAARAEAIRLLAAGRKIEAVKRVREGTGWGLKRSKEAVEALKPGMATSPGQGTAGEGAPLEYGNELDSEVRRLLAGRRKIEAVKLVRERTGWALKEAKEYVERLQAQSGSH